MPNGHKNGHTPLYEGQSLLPPSLVEAIDAFLLSCAARVLRGQADQHMSMLVHVTRFNVVQQTVTTMIETHLQQTRQRLRRQINHLPIIHRLEQLWQSDFLSTSISVRDLCPDHGVPRIPVWDEVKQLVPDILSQIDIRMINGKVKDILDYADRRESGLRVIAVGGDKLARGLTLEGLSVSYFLRASRMYDTLMQMGRWFGYRPGYLDLCRLYTTQELVEWYGHIANASEELRGELDMMAESGATPREYGLKVQSHPVLMVTSRLKMRTARSLMLSFSGTLMETVVLHRDPVILQQNFETTKRLLEVIGAPHESNPVVRIRNSTEQKWNGSHLWNKVPAQDITDFLYSYKTHQGAYKVDAPLMAEFISTMTGSGELTSWTVVLLGGGEGSEIPVTGDITVKMMKRTPNGDYTDRYSIGRLLSPRDEGIDLHAAAWQAALEETRRMWRSDPARMQTFQEPDEPNGPAIRHVRGFGSRDEPAHPERGLMLLYILDPAKAGLPVETPPVVAIGISFPCSNTGHKVEYKVNNITWEQEYGPVG
jgi:hypothetical protein